MDLVTKTIDSNGYRVKLQLWDTAGALWLFLLLCVRSLTSETDAKMNTCTFRTRTIQSNGEAALPGRPRRFRGLRRK